VKIYRSAVKNAANRIAAVVQDLDKTGYNAERDFVGNTEIMPVNNKQFNPIEWHSRRISVTRLAALFPLTILCLWLVVAWLTLKKPFKFLALLFLILDLIAIILGIVRSAANESKGD
jgi:hypothetical protein